MSIDLPDSPAIAKLAEALWRLDSRRHGAAILVGAGFSRCSAIHADGVARLPLWKDLSKLLASSLGKGDQEFSFSDPLQLAEEYRAYFGQIALNDLIKSAIRDEAWRPGSLHADLLKLPWSEVMTTNWDTLLERAASDIHNPVYSLVSKQSDLSSVRSPRIVKLHGSIGVTDRFVVAQEDYRRYPEQFAAFVNFARQVFIENELCLLGFSGDDPNFLKWSGWVRDHLAGHARRMYLVGALKLTASNRRFLESINIVPIDLWDAVCTIEDPDLMHQRATEIFVESLLSRRPEPKHRWEPTSLNRPTMTSDDLHRTYKDSAYAATLLADQIETLTQDRIRYPGWLISPAQLRRQLQCQISDPYPTAKNIGALEPPLRARLLYEIAWRHTVAFDPVSPWLEKELIQIADPAVPCSISIREQLEVALLLLRTARINDRRGDFEKWVGVLRQHSVHLPNCSAEVAYQRALLARDNLDYSGIESVVEEISGDDPLWKMRRASMFAELGRFDDGERLVSEAYRELLALTRLDIDSIRVHSKLAWAQWMLRPVQMFRNQRTQEQQQFNHRSQRCDPWDEITHLRERSARQQEEHFQSKESIEPLFEQGHYKDHSNDERFTSEEPLTFELSCLAEYVGIPLRWDHVVLLSGIVEQLAVSEGLGHSIQDYALAIRAAGSDDSVAIKHMFSRIAVAKAPVALVTALAGRLEQAIAYWRKQASVGTAQRKHHAINVLRVHIEVLARLAIRLSPDEASRLFNFAMELGQDAALRHFWLSEVVGHLAKYSLDSVPDAAKPDLLFAALSFPLANEVGISDAHHALRWPNPVVEYPGERRSDTRLDRRIDELIAQVSIGSPACVPALLRLLPLAKSGSFTAAENDKLANRIWGESPDYLSPPETGLYLHALLALPAHDSHEVRRLLAQVLFDSNSQLFVSATCLTAIAGAATLESNPLFPSHTQAVECFDKLVAWRAPEVKDELSFQLQESLAEKIGRALALSITPSIAQDDLNGQRLNSLQMFCTETGATAAIAALPYFAGLSGAAFATVERSIRKGLQSRVSNEVAWSARGLLVWQKLSIAEQVPSPPSTLFSRMVYLIESSRSIGLHSLLSLADDLLMNKWLAPSDIDTLIDCLPDLYEETDYCRFGSSGSDAVSVPLIRSSCVALARNLVAVPGGQKLDAIVTASRSDPLPEVRFATD